MKLKSVFSLIAFPPPSRVESENDTDFLLISPRIKSSETLQPVCEMLPPHFLK